MTDSTANGITTVTIKYPYGLSAMSVTAAGELSDGTNTIAGIGNDSADYFIASTSVSNLSLPVSALPTTSTAFTGGVNVTPDARAVLTLQAGAAAPGTDGNDYDVAFAGITAATKASARIRFTGQPSDGVDITIDTAGVAGNAWTIVVQGFASDGANATLSGNVITLNIYNGTNYLNDATNATIRSALNQLNGVTATSVGTLRNGNVTDWGGARTINFSGGQDGSNESLGASIDSSAKRVTIRYPAAATALSIGSSGAINDGTSDLAKTGTGSDAIVSLAKDSRNSVATLSIPVGQLTSVVDFTGGTDSSDGDFHSLFDSTPLTLTHNTPGTLTWGNTTDDHRFFAFPTGVVLTATLSGSNVFGSGTGQFARLAQNKNIGTATSPNNVDIYRATNASGFTAGSYAVEYTDGPADATNEGRLYIANKQTSQDLGSGIANADWTALGDLRTSRDANWAPVGAAWLPRGATHSPNQDTSCTLFTDQIGTTHIQSALDLVGVAYSRWQTYWYNGYSAATFTVPTVSNLLDAPAGGVAKFTNSATNPPETLSSGANGLCARFGDIVVAVYYKGSGTTIERKHATISSGSFGSWTDIGRTAAPPSGVANFPQRYRSIPPFLPHYMSGSVSSSISGISNQGGFVYFDGTHTLAYGIAASSPYGVETSRASVGTVTPPNYSDWSAVASGASIVISQGGGGGSAISAIVAGPGITGGGGSGLVNVGLDLATNSGLEFDTTGNSGKVRVKLDGTSLTRGANGVRVTAAAGTYSRFTAATTAATATATDFGSAVTSDEVTMPTVTGNRYMHYAQDATAADPEEFTLVETGDNVFGIFGTPTTLTIGGVSCKVWSATQLVYGAEISGTKWRVS